MTAGAKVPVGLGPLRGRSSRRSTRARRAPTSYRTDIARGSGAGEPLRFTDPPPMQRHKGPGRWIVTDC